MDPGTCATVTETKMSEGHQGATRSPQQEEESVGDLDYAKEPTDQGAESGVISHLQLDSKYRRHEHY